MVAGRVRARAVVVGLALAVILGGCSGGGHHWVSEKFYRGTSWIRFDPDGHFSLNVGGQFAASGTYEIDGHDVVLKLEVGGTKHGEIEGRTFTDWLGTRYRAGPYGE